MFRIVILLLRLYQLTLSPLIGPRCRFMPSCSEYAIDVFRRYGMTKGAKLALYRLTQCHPWGKSGYDPPP